MGLITKLKKSFFFTQMEVGKYTKRRTSTMPEYDSKSRDFYEKNYVDGNYIHHRPDSAHSHDHETLIYFIIQYRFIQWTPPDDNAPGSQVIC
ncbi:hypothetical protein H4R33_000484 [Dimargaris cristalligena]|nr:hypothetical protein H4R33_000484 [Dimargaris cristalligena]